MSEAEKTTFHAQRRVLRGIANLPRALELWAARRRDTTACDVVHQVHTMRLLRYRAERPRAFAQPVLFCYALINRHYILDLEPGRSVVRQYLDQGFDVYIIDWGCPTDADRGLTLDDYVSGFLNDAIAFILREHACERLHIVGYCMGGTLAVLFAALHPRSVQTLTLLAAPLEFGGRESLLNVWTDPDHFDVDAFVDAYGNCPGWFLQSCFVSLKPVQNVLEKQIAFGEQLDDERFLASFFAMERWINDNIPVAGETFREFVKKLYQRNELVRGELCLAGKRIELERITCPVLLIVAKHDHLVPPGSTEGVKPRLGSRDVEVMSIDAGHVGLVVGGKAHKTLWPEAVRWLRARSDPIATGETSHPATSRAVGKPA